MNDFRFETILDESGVAVINVRGDLDMVTAPALREEFEGLQERERPRVAVNLADVSFIDTTGLGLLVGGLKRMRERDGNLVVFGAGERNQKLLHLTGLTAVFASLSTRDEAIAVLEGGQSV